MALHRPCTVVTLSLYISASSLSQVPREGFSTLPFLMDVLVLSSSQRTSSGCFQSHTVMVGAWRLPSASGLVSYCCRHCYLELTNFKIALNGCIISARS